MAEFDLVLRRASVVLTDRVEKAEVGISGGLITAMDESVRGIADAEIDCSGLHVFPGVIDSHVHFNEPGRADWEGLASGSRAVAAGGGTCFFDMPLNSDPPVLDRAAFEAKRSAAEEKGVVDFALWGGLTPLNLDRVEELHEAGAIGFKAFMSNSGIAEFPRADARVLREGMKRVAALGSIVAVHAESEEMTSRLTADAPGTSVRDYLDSRPVQAEWEAILSALELAHETGCALHIVHVSTARGVELVSEAKRAGVNVTCETCPHYLVLTEEDVFALGAIAKCAPPVRSAVDRDALVTTLFAGRLDTLGSDHSPAPRSMKTSDDFFAIWGGISSAQHLLPLSIDLWHRRGSEDWPLLARLLSENVARRFALPDRIGSIALGAEANFAVIDLRAEDFVDPARVHYRHQATPYAGRTLHGKVVRTFLRGQTVARDGQFTGRSPGGRLITPIHR